MTAADSLPELERLTVYDERLCGVARDAGAVRNAGAAAAGQLTRARRRGDRGRERWLLGYLGNVARLLGDADAAETRLRESLALAEELGDERSAVVALLRLGDAYRCAGDPAAAEPLLRAAFARAEVAGPELRDFALQHLGKTLLALGRTDEARRCLEDARELRRAKGDATLLASTDAALQRVDGK
jgi:tetratricopeptide (TPR) repeat protein